MTILKQWFLKIITIVLLVLLCFPLPVQASSFFQPANEQILNMNFEDNQNFYQKLTSALQSGKSLKITTNYTRYSDIPSSLKEILRLKNTEILSLASPGIVVGSAAAANFEPGRLLNIKPNLTTRLIIGGSLGGVAIGAGFGLTAGGIGAFPGCLIGGGIGAVAGLFTASAMDRNYDVVIMIDLRRRVTISFLHG